MRWLVLITSFFMGVAPVYSQSLQLRTQERAQTISVDQALQLAIERNQRIKAEKARAGIAQAAIISAGALPNPALLSDNGVAEDSYRLGIQQTVLLGGKIKNRVRIAQANREGVSAEIKAAIFQLRRDVRNAYMQLYAAQERKRILQLLVEHYDTFAHLATALEDKLQIEFIETTTGNGLQEARYDEEIATHNLNVLLGQPLETVLVLEKPRTTIRGNLPYSQLLASAQNNSPALLQKQAEIKVANSELALAKANRVPNFSFAIGPDLVTPPEVAQMSVFAIGYLDLPVLNRQRGPIQEARARQSQLNLSMVSTHSRVAVQMANAYSSYSYSLARLKDHETHLIPRAQDMQIQAKEAHGTRFLTVDTLVEADTHRAAMELSYLKLLNQNQEAISDLETASGLEL